MPSTDYLILQDHHKQGGAAKAAGRWAQLMRGSGNLVVQAVGDEMGGGIRRLSGKPERGLWRIFECLRGRDTFRKGRVQREFSALLERELPETVWFHNIAGGIKWGWGQEMVGQALAQAQVIWTLHDMWALGDGDPYWAESEKAGKYESSPVRSVVNMKAEHRLVLTAPSQWLANLASKLTGSKCHFLPNPIDLNIYSPGDRQEARGRLGIKSSGLVVLAGADSLKDKRKGMDLLFEAWSEISKEQAALALFGRNGETSEGKIYLGSIESDAQMADAYRAADLYVHPARMENAPCTIQEALACGTPVLAFGVGGIPEMISLGRTGFFVEKVNSNSLSQELGKCLKQPENLRQMRMDCREKAEKDWNPVRLSKMLHEILAGAQ